MKYILNKNELISYIKYKYQESYNEEISLLKLNKSLYFLFGYWIIEQVIKNEEDREIDLFLFPSNFEAWKYGPVDVDVQNNTEIKVADVNFDKSIKIFLDTNLEKIFTLTNFQLVNIVYQHKCWKDAIQLENKQICEKDIKDTFFSFLHNIDGRKDGKNVNK